MERRAAAEVMTAQLRERARAQAMEYLLVATTLAQLTVRQLLQEARRRRKRRPT